MAFSKLAVVQVHGIPAFPAFLQTQLPMMRPFDTTFRGIADISDRHSEQAAERQFFKFFIERVAADAQ